MASEGFLLGWWERERGREKEENIFSEFVTPTVAYSASFWVKLHHACGTGDLERVEMYAGIRFSDVYVFVHHVKRSFY